MHRVIVNSKQMVARTNPITRGKPIWFDVLNADAMAHTANPLLGVSLYSAKAFLFQ